MRPTPAPGGLTAPWRARCALKCTMHRWHFAWGSIVLTVAARPAHWSPTTNPTSLRPRSIILRKNCSQLAAFSCMSSSTAITSRWGLSRSTPMATSTPTFSTGPPQERLCRTPSACISSNRGGRFQHLI